MPTIQTANVELRSANGENVVSVQVPKGASLADLAKIQEQIFAYPEQLGDKFGKIVRGCPNCLSGFRLEFIEERINPAELDLQGMFTNVLKEVREISTRLSAIERGVAVTAPAGEVLAAGKLRVG